MIPFSELIGGVAAFLTTVAFFPQVLKVLRDRDTSSISLGMYTIFTTGVVLWLVYGFMIGSLPIIVGNMVTLVNASIILVMKLRLG